MNDLDYTEWMKFQKSFFRHSSLDRLAEDCVLFFTKEIRPGGVPSKSLLIGFDSPTDESVLGTRQVTWASCGPSIKELTAQLASYRERGDLHDFALVNMLSSFASDVDVDQFVIQYSRLLFPALRTLLRTGAYCGMTVGMVAEEDGPDYPSPWAVALSGRDWMRLRDEKIGLLERENDLYYCLFFQAENDERPREEFLSSSVRRARDPPPSPKWLIPRPPPRRANELVHPAKFPETLVQDFIDTYTKPGDWVLDPMMGTGSTLISAARSRRNSMGVDLNPAFCRLAETRLAREFPNTLIEDLTRPQFKVVQGDAREIGSLREVALRSYKYAITSPPYWSMLRNPGSEGQRHRRRQKLPLYYSDDVRDLGNVPDYESFLSTLVEIYENVAGVLDKGGYLTVVVKNVKRRHVVYPLAWDLVRTLCARNGRFDYAGVTLWCQDDVKLKPFAVGTHWVSNVLHQYCLHFRIRAGAT